VLDYSNRIYTKVKTALGTLIKDASQTFQDTPPSFPFFFFNQIGNDSKADDLDNNENAVNTTVEITIYTTGTTKLTDAKKIMALADVEMRLLGFRRIFGPQQITNIADTTICRYIARFNRVIGSEDVIQ
jgi:hypothetical protein